MAYEQKLGAAGGLSPDDYNQQYGGYDQYYDDYTQPVGAGYNMMADFNEDYFNNNQESLENNFDYVESAGSIGDEYGERHVVGKYYSGSCNRKIKIFWIRHGFSCANAEQHIYKGRYTKAIVSKGTDPPLTHYAVDQIKHNRSEIRKIIGVKPDIVLSSVLLRAEQTAHYLFPEKIISVVPYIKETGFGVDNKPNPRDVQISMNLAQDQKYTTSEKYSRDYFPFDYLLSTDEKTGNWLPEAYVSDYDKFIYSFLPDNLLYLLNINRLPEDKKDINIVIVGHSAFMRKYIRSNPDSTGSSVLKNKINNIGIIELHFCYVLTNNGWKIKKKICPTIHSLQGVGCNKTGECSHTLGCDGVIYHGFPKPNKNDFNSKGGARNCYYYPE